MALIMVVRILQLCTNPIRATGLSILSNVFRGYRKGPVAYNGLSHIVIADPPSFVSTKSAKQVDTKALCKLRMFLDYEVMALICVIAPKRQFIVHDTFGFIQT